MISEPYSRSPFQRSHPSGGSPRILRVIIFSRIICIDREGRLCYLRAVAISVYNYMKDHAASFLAYLRDRGFSENTVERYQRVLEGFLAYLDHRAETELVDPQQITKQLIVEYLRSSGANGSDPSGVVWNIGLSCLRSFFGHLYREELVPENPAAKVEFAKLGERNPTYLTHGEYRAFLETIRRVGTRFYRDRDFAIAVTFYNTGLRLGELVALDIDQIDWSNEVLHEVVRKGGSVKDVYFNGEVTAALKVWLKRRDQLELQTERALFVSDRRRRLGRRSVERLFSHYSKAAGMGKTITPHVLRHSIATELLRRGEDIRVVSEVLNHANLNTTKRYAHLAENAERAAVRKLARTSKRLQGIDILRG